MEFVETTEQRSASRLAMGCKIRIKPLVYASELQNECTAAIRDISISGVLIDAPSDYDIEIPLKLEISVPKWEKYKSDFFKFDKMSVSAPLVIIGKIARKWPLPGQRVLLGVKFTGIDNDHREALKRYIEFYNQ